MTRNRETATVRAVPLDDGDDWSFSLMGFHNVSVSDALSAVDAVAPEPSAWDDGSGYGSDAAIVEYDAETSDILNVMVNLPDDV